LRDSYEEQAAGLLEGGVDLLIIETVSTCSAPRQPSVRHVAPWWL